MGFRYLTEYSIFQEGYLIKPKNYSIKTEQNRLNSFDKLLDSIRSEQQFLKTIALSFELFKECDYTKPKGAYSNAVTQEYIIKLQEYINNKDDTNAAD